MPWYNNLRPKVDYKTKDYSLIFPKLTNQDRKRIISNLMNLRKGLKDKIPEKSMDDSLLLATWNIKEFGHLLDRFPESYFYIAEITNRFDLIAIQEIKGTLKGLSIIMRLLGKHWGYIITEGTAGNSERFGYIYDKRKVEPSGLSGEIVLWDDLTTNSEIKQLVRTPAITGFKSGWKSFAIINIHLHPGNKDDDKKYRKQEVELLLNAIKEKYEKSHFWNENLIILGDTNFYSDNTDIVQLFTGMKFKESGSLSGKFTNVSNNEIYDRIFFRINEYFEMKKKNNVEIGDVFDVFNYVFTEDSISNYHKIMKEQRVDPISFLLLYLLLLEINL